jgi:hypothetical protein
VSDLAKAPLRTFGYTPAHRVRFQRGAPLISPQLPAETTRLKSRRRRELASPRCKSSSALERTRTGGTLLRAIAVPLSTEPADTMSSVLKPTLGGREALTTEMRTSCVLTSPNVDSKQRSPPARSSMSLKERKLLHGRHGRPRAVEHVLESRSRRSSHKRREKE